jgi:hypothetical protein
MPCRFSFIPCTSSLPTRMVLLVRGTTITFRGPVTIRRLPCCYERDAALYVRCAAVGCRAIVGPTECNCVSVASVHVEWARRSSARRAAVSARSRTKRDVKVNDRCELPSSSHTSPPWQCYSSCESARGRLSRCTRSGESKKEARNCPPSRLRFRRLSTGTPNCGSTIQD